MGLTISCARCHDHKFDPILTTDYYGLAGIFASTKSFRNYGRPGAVSYIYYAPLDRDAFDRREAHRREMYAKQIEMERVIAEEDARENQRLRPRLAEYMVSAWRVEHEGASPADLARDGRLDARVLERWVQYLKPTTPARAHLRAWHEADRSTVARVANDYQVAYLKVAARWDQRLAEWRKNFQEEVRQDRDLPVRPSVDKVERQFAVPLKQTEPFFAETSFDGGPFALEESPGVAALRAEFKLLEQSLPPEPPMASAVMDEEQPVQQRVFVRGDPNNPGDSVEKGFPRALRGDVYPTIAHGSGRIELARWLTNPAHPLTARVMVNRVWQWHFDEALVRSPSNWGAVGERPTHPELLDFLASRFVESGWSIKAMHRLILLSSTYQMSSHADRDAKEKDPANRLFSRFNRRRLTVEEIRDSFLAVDGSLDRTVGGPLPGGDSLEESRRRTVYLPVRRGGMPVMLSMFDFGDATASSEARSRTNVAPQALFMMNSEFAANRSLGVAKLLLEDTALSDQERVARAYTLILARPPDAREVARALEYVGGLEAKLGSQGTRLAAWQSFCRLLLSTNEFVYVD